MDNRKLVYHTSRSTLDGSIRTKSIANDSLLPNGYYWTEQEAVNAINLREKIRADDYKKYEPIAMAKLRSTELKIKQLLSYNNCNLDFTYEGDSHGIYDDRIELSININNHQYNKEVRF